MGYLFQNIGQLAGFFLNQNENGSSKSSAVQGCDISFESIFDSLTESFKSKLSDIPENDNMNENIEFAERTFFNADTLKALIEKQGNIVTLEIPSDEISRYLDDLSLPAIDRKHNATPPQIDLAGSTNTRLIGDSAISSCRISFKAADIFNSDYLPVEIFDAEDQKTTQLIDVTRIARLISNYPEPIQMEIEIIPDKDKIQDLKDLKSAFKFDLRNLVGTDVTKSAMPIKGLISLSTNSTANSYNISYNIKSLSKPALFEAKDFQQGHSPDKSNNLDGLFPLNQKISISLLNLKNETPHGGNINRPGKDYVVPESLNEIESTGAGEDNSDNKDNSSALSKISAGSQGASESATTKLNTGSLDGFIDNYELLRGVSIKNNPGDIEELPLRNFENIESIKAAIISLMEQGRSTVRMRLHPPDLGTLHIKLHLRAGSLTTEFRVENAKAGEVVSAILPELKASLEEANLKLTNINVIVNDRGKGFSLDYNSQYQSGFTGNEQDRKDRASFRDYEKLVNETFDEKTGGIGNLGSRSIHKGWIDLKA